MERQRNLVVVSGAFGDIGSAVCARLAGRGLPVCRVARTAPPGDANPGREPGSVIDVGADLASAAGWDRVVESVEATGDRIGAFIHCAGALIAGDVASAAPGEFGKMVDDNLLSLMLGCRALIPGMIRSGGGRIVVLGSLGGIVPMPHVSVYAAMKFAVRGFTLSLAEEVRASGVSVSLLSCGPVRSRMLLRESLHRGSIGFVNRPLPPATVAGAILDLLDRPRREVMLPRSAGWISRAAGVHANLFRTLYPLASAVGDEKKRAYSESVSAPMTIPGNRP